MRLYEDLIEFAAHFSSLKPSHRILGNSSIKVVKAIDGSNHTTTFVVYQIIFNLKDLFDSKLEISVHRFSSHFEIRMNDALNILWLRDDVTPMN